MPIVVSDTSPLRALSHLGCLALLHDLFGEVIVPPAVIAELEHPRSKLPPLLIRGLPYVRIESPRDQALVNDLLDTLDPGESEAIALALELRADLILVDDATAREVASHRGLIALGVLGTLLRAKQKGFLDTLTPLIDRLQGELGFFVSSSVRDQVL